MGLFQLAYVSTSTISDIPAEHRLQLGEILLQARYNNAANQITGALLATDGHFAQLLEGERGAVEATYRRIAADPRHKGLVILLASAIAERRFPTWAMAYVNLEKHDDSLERLVSEIADPAAREQTRTMLNQMQQMLSAQVETGAAA